MKYLILACLFLYTTTLFSNNILTFKPLTANVFEPRIGSFYNLNDNNFRLDIGASFDFVKINENSPNEMSIGADFFTYTRLRSENNFKFPVETSDYFFGLNYSANLNLFDEQFQTRVRLAHISSHLVDGYSENGIFFKMPFVYSREFFDITLAKYFDYSESNYIRPYIGTKVVFSTQPDDVSIFQGQVGFDLLHKINNFAEISAGLNLANGEDMLNTSSQIGFNIKFIKNVGLFLGYYYYNGNSMHGMFYKEKDNYSAIGFQIIYQ